MPIYEYECEACSHHLEALQKISDAPLLNCPSCRAPRLRKKISAVGFRLKGGGWYETDFKSGDKKNVAGDKDGSVKGDSVKEGSAKESSAADTGSSSSSTASVAAPAAPTKSTSAPAADA